MCVCSNRLRLFVGKNDNTPIDEVLLAMKRTNTIKKCTIRTPMQRAKITTKPSVSSTELHKNVVHFQFNHFVEGHHNRNKAHLLRVLKIWPMPHRNTPVPVEQIDKLNCYDETTTTATAVNSHAHSLFNLTQKGKIARCSAHPKDPFTKWRRKWFI